MIHFNEISATDATKVCRVRRVEIANQMNRLNYIVADLNRDRSKTWADVGSLSHILEQLEELTSSFGYHSGDDEAEVREIFHLPAKK